MKEYICSTCSTKFQTRHSYRNPKFCSQTCYFRKEISPATREKMSFAKKGKYPWNKGVHMWEGKEHPRGTLGMKLPHRPVSDETKIRLSISHRGIKYPDRSGAKSHFWKGGITEPNEKMRKSAEYRNWRRKVFERDKFICQICKKVGGYLHADHILPFCQHVDKRLDIENGRTLCLKCHRATDTYGGKMHRKKQGKDAIVKKNGKVTEEFDGSDT